MLTGPSVFRLLQSLRNMIGASNGTTDACETRDPCQHGGICISTDSGPFCECRSGEYEGIYCEKGKRPAAPLFPLGPLDEKRTRARGPLDIDIYVSAARARVTLERTGRERECQVVALDSLKMDSPADQAEDGERASAPPLASKIVEC